MKRFNTYILIFVFFFSGIAVFAQNEKKQEIPEGMEEIKIGGSAKLIVPKGAKTRKVGAQIIVEGTKEYMSRRFSEMTEQLKRIEATQAELQEQLKTLEKTVKSIQEEENTEKTDDESVVSGK